MLWFHCTSCDKWSSMPKGFQELRHFVHCPVPCDTLMQFNRHGQPEEIYSSKIRADSMQVKGELVAQYDIPC